MFDRGFTTEDDTNASPLYTNVPREGCAIFLGAIKELRGDPSDFDQQLFYTTVHELGHIYNLTHNDSSSRSFMSQTKKQMGDNVFEFDAEEKRHLSRAEDYGVRPGGEDFGVGSLYGYDASSDGRKNRLFGLECVIDMTQREFWPFEPVELDITLRVSPGLDRTFRIADEIDPGYEAFRIWIEQPNGERRYLRSPRHYCASGETITITPRTPFNRDVSIFGESGGYTFRVAGIHKIWATYDLGRRGEITSNCLEVNIRTVDKEDAVCGDYISNLSRNDYAKILYHRSASVENIPLLKQLESFADRHPKSNAAATVRYAIGRFFADLAAGLTSGERAHHLEAAKELLIRATDHEAISVHRRQLSEKTIRSISC